MPRRTRCWVIIQHLELPVLASTAGLSGFIGHLFLANTHSLPELIGAKPQPQLIELWLRNAKTVTGLSRMLTRLLGIWSLVISIRCMGMFL
jgi:hypothetical protein